MNRIKRLLKNTHISKALPPARKDCTNRLLQECTDLTFSLRHSQQQCLHLKQNKTKENKTQGFTPRKTVRQKTTITSGPSCLQPPEAGITGMCYHTPSCIPCWGWNPGLSCMLRQTLDQTSHLPVNIFLVRNEAFPLKLVLEERFGRSRDHPTVKPTWAVQKQRMFSRKPTVPRELLTHQALAFQALGF